MAQKLLISDSDYKASGIYIGMKQRTAQMKEYIYRVRPDGLSLLNINKIDQRIRTAAKMLTHSKKIIVVGRKNIVSDVIKKFGEITDSHIITGRFMPGTLTNTSYKNFYEADVIIVVDPQMDYQALNEAVKARIPVIGVCDTFNDTRNVDLVIPANNKGVRSLATLFWLLARELQKERGEIESDEQFTATIEDFAGGKLNEEQEE